MMTRNDYFKSMAHNISYLTWKNGKNRNIVAKEMHVSPNTLCEIEHMRANPTLEMMLKIAEFFNVPLEDLLSKDLLKEDKKDEEG